MDIFDHSTGDGPLLVSIPHTGTDLPDSLRAVMTPAALALPDTDWHLDRLYDFAKSMGATVIRANYSRYAIDLNRPPDGASLYPGAENTELCPLETFDRAPIYRSGSAPDADEIARRLDDYWRPYHRSIEAELDRIREKHGYALLYDAHSIRSLVPRFFDGELPSFNIGTGGGPAAAPRLAEEIASGCASAQGYTTVLNGRFKGGYITRHYGAPKRHIHAVQMELAQKTYMDEDPPYELNAGKADEVRPVLRRVLEIMLEWGQRVYG